METKTDMEPDIHLTVQPTMTVGEVHKEIEKKMGWLPTSQLKRCAWHPLPLSLFLNRPGRCMGMVVSNCRGKHNRHLLSQSRTAAQRMPFSAAAHEL